MIAISTITLGPTAPGPTIDSGNGGLLCVTKYNLTQQATLQALSFNVKIASGQLNLGVYADNNGMPGALVAQTGLFTPVVGWNFQLTQLQPILQPGSYWLAYLAQNNALAFSKTATGGVSRAQVVAFGAMPATFPAGSGTSSSIWSMYATLAVVAQPPPPPPPSAIITINISNPAAATVAVNAGAGQS